MTERTKLKKEEKEAEFRKPSEQQYFPSGSSLLDLALGGGWALGRIFNIIGDSSTGKSLLALEGFINFQRTFPKGRMRYAEAEAALDSAYADSMGFPQEVERPEEPISTVEEFQFDLDNFIKKCKSNEPGLYILDSLDSLTDDA